VTRLVKEVGLGKLRRASEGTSRRAVQDVHMGNVGRVGMRHGVGRKGGSAWRGCEAGGVARW
jgi:hypothetical protein